MHYNTSKMFGPFESSFRTFDAFDYSAIGILQHLSGQNIVGHKSD